MGDPRRYIYSIGMHHGKHKTAQAGRQKTQYRGGSSAAIASMPCNRAGHPPRETVLRISQRSEHCRGWVEKQSGVLRLERPPVLLHRFVALRLAQRGERVRVRVLQVLPSLIVRCVNERVLLPGEHLLHAVVGAED